MSSSSPPSKKLLKIDPNPKPKSKPNKNPSPNSPSKRTRDQPNLSNCHSCNLHVNPTNPKDRLQPLQSLWRILLLCRKCRTNFNSGQTCPYCFLPNSGDQIVTCTVCDRKIHKDCVFKYSSFAPWCYLGLGEFSVCVDCWVPESFKNSVTVCWRKDKSKTKEEVLSRGKNAVEKTNKKKKGGGLVKVVDDKELAIRLHLAMNSSPRISRSKSLSVSGLGGNGKWGGLFYKRSRVRKVYGEGNKVETCGNAAQRLLPYKRDKKRKVWMLNDGNDVGADSRSDQLAELEFKPRMDNDGLLETAFRGYGGDQCSSRVNVGSRFGKELLMYKRTKRKVQLTGSCDNKRVVFVSGCGQPDDAENRTDQLVKCDVEAVLPIRSGDVERDRYRLKYHRRVMGTESDSNCMHSDDFLSASKASAIALKNDRGFDLPATSKNQDSDRYGLKYFRRAKSDSKCMHSDTSLNANKTSALALSSSGPSYAPTSDGELGLPANTKNQDSDRYSCKYVRRAKSYSNCMQSYTFLNAIKAPALSLSSSGPIYALTSDDELGLPANTKNRDSGRFSFKYVRRAKMCKSDSNFDSKFESNDFLNENGKSAAGLTMNCSAESSTKSDVSFHSLSTDSPNWKGD